MAGQRVSRGGGEASGAPAAASAADPAAQIEHKTRDEELVKMFSRVVSALVARLAGSADRGICTGGQRSQRSQTGG